MSPDYPITDVVADIVKSAHNLNTGRLQQCVTRNVVRTCRHTVIDSVDFYGEFYKLLIWKVNNELCECVYV